jgi:anti-sigma factor RsiW
VTCREFADFIADYLTGELSAEVRAQFEHHLQICTNCVNYLGGYKAAIALGKAAFEGTDDLVPTEVPEDLVKAILASRR